MQMEITLLFALLVSVMTIRLTMPLAVKVGLVDRPGGHKQHDDHVPLVGGVGIFGAFAAVLVLVLAVETGAEPFFGSLLVGSALLFLVGLVDDVRPLGVQIRFLAQGVAATITALWGGFLLQDFGNLLGNWVFALGLMALPVTLFATAGVINALNMSDGIDGLSGSLSFVTLVLLAIVAYAANQANTLVVVLALLGAVAGFLVFNLRCCGRRRAHIFMGDSGSTVLGFLFACLFVGLSQGEDRAMAPVIALWLFALPLYDTTATMIRRIWLRKSPVRPDRWHLHHLLLDAGFTVTQGVVAMATLHLALGTIGLLGWHHGVADYTMFTGFLGLFGVYLYAVSRPWRFVPTMRGLHRQLDAPVEGVLSIFIGGLPASDPEKALRALIEPQLRDYGYRLYRHTPVDGGGEGYYAILDVGCERATRKVIRRIRAQVPKGSGTVVRQLVPRQARNDRRWARHERPQSRRRRDRRDGISYLVATHAPGVIDISAYAADPGRAAGPMAGANRAMARQMANGHERRG